MWDKQLKKTQLEHFITGYYYKIYCDIKWRLAVARGIGDLSNT